MSSAFGSGPWKTMRVMSIVENCKLWKGRVISRSNLYNFWNYVLIS